MNLHGLRKHLLHAVIAFGTSTCVLADVIPVSNVEDLYRAVNDPGNKGATLILAPGVYMLSAIDPSGVPRPKGGRIELQPDMSMQGVEGDRAAVVINAVNLPATSFPNAANGVATGPNAAVRIGLGYNSIEWLTVRDAKAAQANIDVGLQPRDPGPAYIRVAHVDSSGSTRGLNILNFGPASSGQTIEADIVDCHFHDNPFGVSEGIRMGNFQGARGGTVNVRMTGNSSWGQKQGRLIVNNSAIASTVNVVSSGNRFFENGIGTVVIGGLSAGERRADGNTIEFEAHGDQFIGNEAPTEFDHGGLLVLGGENVSNAGGSSGNTVNVRLWGTRSLENDTYDLAAIGARSLSASSVPLSRDNRVTLEIRGSGGERGRWQPVEYFADALPDAGMGNSVTVVRH